MTVVINGDSGMTTPTGVFADGSGNVGIGTSSPNTALSIRRGASTDAYIDIAGNNNTLGSTSLTIGQAADDVAYIFQRKNAALVMATNNIERMRINSSGNVGIGTSSPTSKLHVYGDTVTATIESTANSDGNIRFKNSGAWYTVGMLGFAGATDLSFFDNNAGAERAKINTSGQFFTMDGAGNVKAAYAARAWVNFNGTGTVAIRASGNVTSITDNGTGDYTVNFTTAMSDTNYAVMGTGGESTTSLRQPSTNYGLQAPTTTTARIQIVYQNGAVADSSYVNIAVFR